MGPACFDSIARNSLGHNRTLPFHYHFVDFPSVDIIWWKSPCPCYRGQTENPCEDSCVTLGSVEVIAISIKDLSVFIIDHAPCAG